MSEKWMKKMMAWAMSAATKTAVPCTQRTKKATRKMPRMVP